MRNGLSAVTAVIVLMISVLPLQGCGGSGTDTLATPEPVQNEFTKDELIREIEESPVPDAVDEALYRELSDALIDYLRENYPDRIASQVPSGPAGRVTELLLSEGVLVWTYKNSGDYNGDGQVTINDLSNIGIHYQKTPQSPDWDKARSADGNNDGEVNIGDITPIGQNYLSEVSGYKVLTADDSEGPFTELSDIPLENARPDSQPLEFEFSLPAVQLDEMIFVQPYDADLTPGELSKGVPTGGGGSLATLPGPPSDPLINHTPLLVPSAPPGSDFSLDSGRTGLYISRTRLVVCLEQDVTVGDANQLLTQIGAEVIGSLSGINILVIEMQDPGDLSNIHNTLTTLDNDSRVYFAVEDCLLSSMNIDNPSDDSDSSVFGGLSNQASPNPWRWDWPPSENGSTVNGNWGMEAVRAPFAWNLFDHGRRQGDPARTVVVDVGFNNAHNDDDLDSLALKTIDGTDVVDGVTTAAHGTHVAGTVGAAHYNNSGVGGMNPLLGFADPDDELFVGITARDSRFDGGTYQGRETCFDSTMFDIYFAWNEWSDTRVVNTSLGYNWALSSIDTSTTSQARELARDQGRIMRFLASAENDKLLCTAAGNDSNASFGWAEEQEAVWASPMCWAALDPEISFPGWLDLGPSPNIIVVESTQALVTDNSLSENSWEYTKSDFSNPGGHVAAPGSHILSVVGNNLNDRFGNAYDDYETFSGTSMATPLVTGLVSFIASLDPGLDAAQLRSIITDEDNTRPVALESGATLPAGITDPARQVDAFAAVTSIDGIRGNRTIQRALVDVDDGTRDGNLRTRVSDDANHSNPTDPDPDMIHTSDGRRGDGETTMKDFRTFRDAWLHSYFGQFDAQLELDGASSHFKKDYNMDGAVQTMSRNGNAASPAHPLAISTATTLNNVLFEDNYSRYDFNGDGQLEDWSATAPYRIATDTAFGTDTDLAVNSAPGMLRDIDVLASAGNWQIRDVMYEQSTDPEYFENVSVNPSDEGVSTFNHWSPQRYLIDNRDADASVSAFFSSTPDYLHSCDLHFNLDWSWLLLGGSSSIDITVTSEIDGVVPDFVRSGTFDSSDPWKFVLTVPVWTDTIEIEYSTNSGINNSFTIESGLGKDIPVRMSAFYQIPDVFREFPDVIELAEPVYWIRYLGPGEGYYLRTAFLERDIDDSKLIKFSSMYSGNGTWSEPIVVADVDDINMLAGADLYGYPAIVFDDGNGNLRFKSTEDGQDWDSLDRLIDSGADFNYSQIGFAQSHQDDDFIFWSKDNGSGTDHVYFSMNEDFTQYQFGAPQDLGPGIAPAVGVKPENDGLFLVMFNPKAPDMDSAVRLRQWQNGPWEFSSDIDLPLEGLSGDPAEGAAFDIGLFGNGLAISLLNGGDIYWFDGVDGESMTIRTAGEFNLPGELPQWVRPQVVGSSENPAILMHGRIYRSQDSEGNSWQQPINLSTPGYMPDPNFMRFRSNPDGLFSFAFMDMTTSSLVIQGDFPQP